MLHDLKLDGVSALLAMSERDLRVSVVYFYFFRPSLSLVDASVSESFLHGTQDPELCASLSCSVSARSVFRGFLSQLSICLQFVSLFPRPHLEFSSIGAFWTCFFWGGVSASRVKSKRDIRLWYLFNVAVFSVLVLGRFFRPVPLLSPAVAGVGATSVLIEVYGAVYHRLAFCCSERSFWIRVFSSTLESREFLSAG